MTRRNSLAWCGALAALVVGARTPAAPPAASHPVFVDATEAAGIRWGIQELALRGPNLVETMGGGGGFVDYDGDGWLDLYLVSYSTRPQAGRVVGDALYHNNRDGTFTDVTKQAGIAGERRGMGLAVADYDNDGWSDIYVTAFGSSVLYRNRGDGTFEDVTARPRVSTIDCWGCSTTFLDYDRDGRPDLFVSNYLDYDPEHAGDYPCEMIDDHPFCTIAKFKGQPSVLFRNRGDGRFEDKSAAAGIALSRGQGHGGRRRRPRRRRPRGSRPGRTTRAPTSSSATWVTDASAMSRWMPGVAYDASGRTTGAMATDAEDVDGDGRLDLVVTNFNNQGTFLLRNDGSMSFSERGASAGLSLPTFKVSTFGARFLDYDNDGDPDLFVAAGHPFAPVAKVWPEIHYADPPFLFENEAGRFRDVARERGEALGRRTSAAAWPWPTTTTTAIPTCCCWPWASRRGCCATTAATGATGWACGWWAPAAAATPSGRG